ncbi:hypothetical protein OY671_007423 [Metschnikowia pulcherrima]|nr:hypothetical protein OY671_007423 [Metschnikowia pulcherrima]
MIWGLVAIRRRPRVIEVSAVVMATVGAVVSSGRSSEIGARTSAGDSFCIVAGSLYVVYISVIQQARGRFGSWSSSFSSSLAGSPVVAGIASAMGEPFWPHDWGPSIGSMSASQIVGQGSLVYASRHFPPSVVGSASSTQPIVSVSVGWSAFHEVSSGPDASGMASVGAASVSARSADR